MIYRFGDFTLDEDMFELRKRDRVVHLERRVFDILRYLVAHRFRVVSKAELFDEIWEGRKVSEASLTVAVAAIRRTLGDDVQAPLHIATAHGRGYRFVAPTIVEDGPQRGRAGWARVGRSTFVGRHAEMESVQRSLEFACAGQRQVCILSGEAGIGKTRFVEEFARRLRSSRVGLLWGRCLEEDGAPSFWPWVQVLRQIDERALSSLPSDVAMDLKALMLGTVPCETSTSRSRFRLFDAVARCLQSIGAETPLVVAIDDVHRADRPSLLLLEFVVCQLRRSRLLFLLCDRDAETQRSEIHSQVLGTISREEGSRNLLLLGLSRSEVEEMVAGTGSGANVDALVELTGGNPFFLTQVLSAIAVTPGAGCPSYPDLPLNVREAVARQVGGLSAESQAALTVASVVGRDFTMDVVAQVCDDRSMAVAGLEEAIRARILVGVSGDSGGLRFCHAIVRDAIYERIPHAERCKIHGAVAAAMVSSDGGSKLLLPQVAHHYFSAGQEAAPRKAIEACAAAGWDASSRLAYEEAVVHFRRALEITRVRFPAELAAQCDLHLAIGRDLARAGERDGSKSSFTQAAVLARELSDVRRLARAAMGASSGLFAVEAGAPDSRVIALLREALGGVERQDTRVRARLLGQLAMALAWFEQGRERDALVREAARLAESEADRSLKVEVLIARWFAEWIPEGHHDRWSLAHELLEEARQLKDHESLLVARLFWATCLLEQGDAMEFRREVTRFERDANALRQPEAWWYALLLQAADALLAGDLARAEALSAQLEAIGRFVNDANIFHCRMTHRILIAYERGKAAEMVDAAEQGRERYPMVVGWHAAHAWALCEANDEKGARRELAQIVKTGLQAIPKRMDWPVTMMFLGDLAIRYGDRELASAVYQQLMPLRGHALVLGLCVASWGCASRYLGRLAEALGIDDAAANLLEEAVARDDASGARSWAAHSRYELSRFLLRRVGTAAAHERGLRAAQEASETAQELGLVRVQEGAESLLNGE